MTATVLTMTVTATPTHAADPAGVTASEATAALAEVPGLLTDTVTRSTRAPGEAITTGALDTPVHADDGIEFGSLTIDLPGAGDANPAVRVNAGTAIYPSDGSYATAVQATPDGGVRALVIIDNADAPTEYRFPMAGATHLTANPDGGLTVWNGTTIVATVAAPWATDANRAPVTTRYRIDGTTIIQTVHHHGAAYPIVADPAFREDCGWVTCSVYLSRSTTRSIADVVGRYPNASMGTIAFALALACAPIGGIGAVVCAGAAGVYGGFAIDQFIEARRLNRCIRVRYTEQIGVAPPVITGIYVDSSKFCEN